MTTDDVGHADPRAEARTILRDLAAIGAGIRADGDRLRVSPPPGGLTDALAARIRGSKEAVLDILRTESPSLEALPRDRPLPLGIVQQRMWMMDRLEPDSTVNNLPGAWRLLGELDVDAFERALVAIVERHEILRSSIVFDGQRPAQAVDHAWSFELPITDLSDVPEEMGRSRMMERIVEERDVPFDLGSAPLFRCRLFVFDATDHVFFLLPHHAIWDGWSWDVFLDELSTLYSAFSAGQESPLDPLTVQFADYAVWHRRLMDGPEFERQMAYWEGVIGEGVPALDLPTDRARTTERSRRGERRTVALEGEVVARLRAVGSDERATLFMVLLAAYVAWLHRRSGQGDFAVGVPIQDRLHEAAHALIGVLVNTLIIRPGPRGDLRFTELVRQIRDLCVEAYDHQDVPLDRILEAFASGRRDRTHDPIFQTLFAYQDVRDRPATLADLDLQQVHIDTDVCPSDLLFAFMVGDDRAVGLFDFDADLFESAAIDRMSESFVSLLHDVAAHPERRLSELVVFGSRGRAERGAGAQLFRDSAEVSTSDSARPSTSQEATWTMERLAPGTGVNHLVEAFELEGDLDVGTLERALQCVVERHEALRLAMHDVGGRPELEYCATATLPCERSVVAEDDLEAGLRSFSARPFDLDAPPLLRAGLFELEGEDRWVMCLVAHELVADEHSMGVILDDLGRIYRTLVSRGDPATEAPPVGFSTFVAWERDQLASDAWRKSLAWWSDELSDLPPPVEVPGDHPSRFDPTFESRSVWQALPSSVVSGVDALSEGLSVSPNAVFIAAVDAVLRRNTGVSDVTLGVVLRISPDGDDSWQNVVGPMRNTAVHRSGVPDPGSVGDEVARVGGAWSRVQEHAAYPFQGLVEHLRPERTVGGAPPIFQVSLTPSDRTPTFEIPGVASTRREVPRPGLQEDLAFSRLVSDDGTVRLRLDYRTARFERASATAILAQVVSALETVVASPAAPAGLLLRVTDAERDALLELAEGPSRPLVARSVVESVEAIVGRLPERTAIADREGELTYGALWSRAGQVAAALHGRGAGEGSVVGASFERSVEMVVGLLGIWRAGAAYLPLDPEFPEDRLAFMITDSGTDLILTDGYVRLPETAASELTLSDVESDGGEETSRHPVSDDLAYVLYTSGSTGRPKGVEVTHRNLINFIESMIEEPGIGPDDVLMAITTLSFDISGLELWGPLSVGARVEVADDREVYDGGLLATRIAEAGVTLVQATPATWRMLIDSGWPGRVGRALCGGEAFPADLVEPLLERADEVWNMYGPTETTIWSTVSQVGGSSDGAVSIGRPIINTSVYVTGADGRLSPPAVPGELWIGGEGVARGYRGRPDLTDDRFLPDPFLEGGRVYRTGDLGRWRSDGCLEHLGRLDDQVKIRGHRIELGEIEAVMARHPAVRAAVATVHGSASDARLSAYFVPVVDGPHVTGSELRRYLRASLPDYMVPGVMSALEELPLTPNGKVDRRALDDPSKEMVRTEFVQPRTDEETQLAEIWISLLGVDRVGVHDNFFELGGHSLLAIRAATELENTTGLRVDPRSLFFNSLKQVAESATTAR